LLDKELVEINDNFTPGRAFSIR